MFFFIFMCILSSNDHLFETMHLEEKGARRLLYVTKYKQGGLPKHH